MLHPPPREGLIEVFESLVAANIGQIQVGWAGRSQSDVQFIAELKKTNPNVVVETMATIQADDWAEQVHQSTASHADVIALIHPTSAQRWKHLPHGDVLGVTNRVRLAVEQASSRHPNIRFGAVDAFRAEEDTLVRLLNVAVDAGAKRVALSDTTGGATPRRVEALVKRVVSETGVPVQVHCHNDFGLALANTLAAFAAGATILDATILGLGERTGNTPLEELVVALEVLESTSTGFELAKLYSLCQTAAQVFGAEVPYRKPWVGEGAFAHYFDLHVTGILHDPSTYEIVDPALVGNQRMLPRTEGTIRGVMSQMGLAAANEVVATIKKSIATPEGLIGENVVRESVAIQTQQGSK